MITQTIRSSLLGVVVLMVGAAPCWGQASTAPQPEDRAREGISVHGHWTIEVVRDGQVIKSLEFQNALTGTGTVVLSRLLTGNRSTSGVYRVSLEDLDASTLECDDISADVGACRDDVPSTQGDGSQVLLEVSFSVTSAGTISRVQTALEECASATTPDGCSSGSFLVYTETDLTTPETVESGDTVNVSVLITFS